MPQHHVFTQKEVSDETRRRLQDSLVLVHGGMAQNVGPILEMVTEKYLLRCEHEWAARQDAIGIAGTDHRVTQSGGHSGHRPTPRIAIFTNRCKPSFPGAATLIQNA